MSSYHTHNLFIDYDTIMGLYNQVFNEKYEICGYLKPSENTRKDIIHLVYDNNSVSRGTEEAGRALCVYQFGYSKYMIHSHPESSKPYPSMEDIRKLFKHYGKIGSTYYGEKGFTHSFIITSAGLWVLRGNEYNKKMYEESLKMLQPLDSYIKKQCDMFYPAAKKKDIEKLISISTTVSKVLNMSISLYPWTQLLNNSEGVYL